MSNASGACLVSVYDEMQHWLVVRTKSRQEKIAVSHLRQRNVLPYCPMFQEPPWHKRAPKGPVPLFSGYVFVRCNPFDRYNAVNYCPGVLNIVRFGGLVATVEQSFVRALRLREGSLGHILSEEESRTIPLGRQVEIKSGPLRKLRGVFKGYLRGGQRARVLMDFLRTQKLIEVDALSLAVVT